NVEAKCLCRLQIDHELELGRLYDGQVGWLISFENPSSVDAGLAIAFSYAGPIAHQAASDGVFTPFIDRRNRMASSQSDDLIAPAVEERIGRDEKRASALLGE